MDVEHLREFVVFCETLNYSKAAKKLFIAQPTLIQHVAKLEKETGLSLVTHDGSPRLTETGALFQAEILTVLATLDRALERCRAQASKHSETIRIVNARPCFDASFFEKEQREHGTTSTFVDFDVASLDEFQVLDEKMADFSITFSSMDQPSLFEGVDLNDYGFVEQPALGGFALMNRDHPLAKLDTIPLTALAGYTVLNASEKFYRRNGRSLELLFADHGVRASFNYVPSASTDVLLKSDHDYVALYNSLSKSFRDIALFDHAIVSRPLESDDFLFHPTAIYRLDNPNPHIADYAERWREHVKTKAEK